MTQLQRWWRKFGPCCGTLAKGFQTRCLLKILDGCRFSSLEEVGEVSLEKMKIVDGYHFSSLEEVGEVSLEKKKIVDGYHFSSLREVEMEVGEVSLEMMVTPEKMRLFKAKIWTMHLELVPAQSRNNSSDQRVYRVSDIQFFLVLVTYFRQTSESFRLYSRQIWTMHLELVPALSRDHSSDQRAYRVSVCSDIFL